jgi:nucleoid-associated protein YgaU
MADAGLNADKLTAQADGAGRGSTSRSPSRYTVRSGDTLERIADRVYGDSSKWRLIHDANRSRLGPDGTLEIGMELSIPRP